MTTISRGYSLMMSNEIRKDIDLVSQLTSFGDGFANKNDGIGDTPDSGFDLNPDANPADIAKALAEVAKRLTPGQWAAISDAAGVPPEILLPRGVDP